MSNLDIATTLRAQIDAMVRWLCAEGRPIPPAVLSQVDASDLVTMGRVHQELARLIEPARPGTIQLFDELDAVKGASEFFGIKRAIRLARGFIYLALASLASFMVLAALLGVLEIQSYVITSTYTSESVSRTGWETLVNLVYLLLAASLGASFQTLFTINRYIINGTYDPTHNIAHVIRYVMGLVAGIMLAELLWPLFAGSDALANGAAVDFAKEPSKSTALEFSKAVIAIIGGFSSSLVYRVLQRLVSAVSSIMDGDLNLMEQRIAREHQTRAKLLVAETQIEDGMNLQEALTLLDTNPAKAREILQELVSAKKTGLSTVVRPAGGATEDAAKDESTSGSTG